MCGRKTAFVLEMTLKEEVETFGCGVLFLKFSISDLMNEESSEKKICDFLSRSDQNSTSSSTSRMLLAVTSVFVCSMFHHALLVIGGLILKQRIQYWTPAERIIYVTFGASLVSQHICEACGQTIPSAKDTPVPSNRD